MWTIEQLDIFLVYQRGHLFGISKWSVCIIPDEFCTIMAEVMLARYIKIPTGESLDKVMDTFEQKWGFS